MLEIRRISKHHADASKEVISDLSLRVAPGELLVILGTSGSGKTTLLKMINGLETPSSGEILIDGKPATAYDPVMLRRQVGYVFQHIGLFPHMNAAENITVNLKLAGVPRRDRKRAVEKLLRQVNLDPKIYRKRFPGELSGGQQQRVGVARALALSPKLLLMDEPFAACDPMTRNALQGEILALKKSRQHTIIFVTHDIHEAMRLGDRIAIMDKGRLQQVDTPQNIQQHPRNNFVKDFISRQKSVDPQEDVVHAQ